MKRKATFFWDQATDKEVQLAYHKHPEMQLMIFIRRYSFCVLTTAAAILKDERDAEEVSSDTFMALSKQLKLEVIVNVKAWLKLVVKRKSISRLRADARRKEICKELVEDDESPLQTIFSDQTEWSEEKMEACMKLFFNALKEYDGEDQILVLGRLFHSQPYEELADEIQWDVEKAKRRFATVIRTIKKKLKQSFNQAYFSLDEGS